VLFPVPSLLDMPFLLSAPGANSAGGPPTACKVRWHTATGQDPARIKPTRQYVGKKDTLKENTYNTLCQHSEHFFPPSPSRGNALWHPC